MTMTSANFAFRSNSPTGSRANSKFVARFSDRCGVGARSDFDTSEWQDSFRHLETVQSEFLEKESEFRSRVYEWPRDPLHTWSRVWEYPYIYRFLKAWKKEYSETPFVVDLGSGVTFFPTAIARLGYAVTCTDTDPVCESDVPAAARAVDHAPGSISFRLSYGARLPFRDEEADLVYCISVLEHIPDFENTIAEIARILKPAGRLLLTLDLDLNGKHDIGAARFFDLRATLDRYFELILPETTVHPADQLTSVNSPYPLAVPKGLHRLSFVAKQLIKPLVGRKPKWDVDYELCVAGFALTKHRLELAGM